MGGLQVRISRRYTDRTEAQCLEFYRFDSDYVERLVAGDREFEQHFTEYFSRLLLIKLRARRYETHVIDDIRQETFLRVFEALRREGIRSPERIGAFVNSVCNNVMLEFGRSGSRLKAMDSDLPEVADSAAHAERELLDAETQAEVRQVLAEMTPQNRRLLTMLFVEERDKEDICRDFGVDRNYLRVLLFRARAEFKERLLKRKEEKARPGFLRAGL